MLIGLAEPSAGTRARSQRRAPSCRTPMALVFQDARLLPWRRVIANVAFGLEGSGLSKAERLAKAQAMLDLVGLGDLGQRWPHQLSGGQRQRVAIARALAVDPDVLLMDEPFSALDSFTREGLQDELQRIQAATGKTILFVTHDIDEAVTLADRVVVLAGSPGRLAAEMRVDGAPAPAPARRRPAGGRPAIADGAVEPLGGALRRRGERRVRKGSRARPLPSARPALYPAGSHPFASRTRPMRRRTRSLIGTIVMLAFIIIYAPLAMALADSRISETPGARAGGALRPARHRLDLPADAADQLDGQERRTETDGS